MVIRDLLMIPFAEAFALQQQLAAEVLGGSVPDTLLLLEHPPVYTIGRGGDVENVLDPEVELVRINRGGDVTFHGPGQLVGYPLIHLGRRGRDLHRYVRFLEEVLIRTAADFRVPAGRRAGNPGVWTGSKKLASIGVGMRRWTTLHGFALNVDPELAAFARINPCGLAGCTMTSLAAEGADPVPMAAVKDRVRHHFLSLLEIWLPVTA